MVTKSYVVKRNLNLIDILLHILTTSGILPDPGPADPAHQVEELAAAAGRPHPQHHHQHHSLLRRQRQPRRAGGGAQHQGDCLRAQEGVRLPSHLC